MSHEYEAPIAGAFLDFMEKGYVYRVASRSTGASLTAPRWPKQK